MPAQIRYFFIKFAKKIQCFLVLSFSASINSTSPSTTLVAYKFVANCWHNMFFSSFCNATVDSTSDCYAPSMMVWHKPESCADPTSVSLFWTSFWRESRFCCKGPSLSCAFCKEFHLSSKLNFNAWTLHSRFDVFSFNLHNLGLIPFPLLYLPPLASSQLQLDRGSK